MNGAESLVRTLLNNRVDTCFANPGTSELHFVSALDRVPGMHCVLTLFEGVATGCADGYARITGNPAATLLHCGPGFANGLANLHNARRANSPVVNIVGDQATQHRPLDSNLTADTEGWARPVSAWVRTAATAAAVGSDAAVAVQAARTAPGQIATLILPADTAWDEGGIVADSLPVPPTPVSPPHTIRQIAELLRGGEPSMLFLSRNAVRERGLNAAYRIAASTGAQLMAQQANPCIARGRGRPPIECLPYAMDQAVAALAGVHHLVLAGAVRPVAVFAYPNRPGYLTSADTTIHVLARLDQDPVQALEALADELGAPHVSVPGLPQLPEPASGALTSSAVGQTLAALMPEHAIVSDEGVTFRAGIFAQTRDAPPHDWMQNLGSAIGMGLPLATGAAIGAPGRRVITLQADGSAMYTMQALWTQARERLDVTTLLFANRKYAILLDELANVGAQTGPASQSLTDIGNPSLDWIKIANGMGVEAAAAHNCEQLADLLRHSFHTPGPFLIELQL
ncbi:MAG TPA: acetolactate synthase large subunit [Terracidiphilus sp.]|nr:acetolactate synthase large subunit [Terracidiphilus sp.]